MKRSTIIEVIIILILALILSILIKFTIKSINKNSIPQEVNNDMLTKINDNSTLINYLGATEITKDTVVENEEYSSEIEDENAILVFGNIEAQFSNVLISKTGDSTGGDNTSFYGINSGILAKDGANLILKNITVSTNATGANGVFSYGGNATTKNTSSDETTITINDSQITTSKDNSGGIMATGGGMIKANNLTINTKGTSSAAIRSDRGGGVIIVNGGTYTTEGKSSPSIYSTAEITINDATLLAEVSEGIVIEGKNSVTINNCNLIDSNTKLNGLSTTYKNIFLYQSMSGDANEGTSKFTANNSNITTNNGDTFYVTNTSATITLTNNKIINNDINGNFLRAKSDSWGNKESNGGDVTLILNNQSVEGDIVVDSVSKLNMTMNTNSHYVGKINSSNTANNIILKLDNTSSIKLTGDSYVTSLENTDLTNNNIDFNGYKLYVDGICIN